MVNTGPSKECSDGLHVWTLGSPLLDLTATTLCTDRPLLTLLGSVYRSELARMRPRCHSLELGSERGHGKVASYLLRSPVGIVLSDQRRALVFVPNCLDSPAYLPLK